MDGNFALRGRVIRADAQTRPPHLPDQRGIARGDDQILAGLRTYIWAGLSDEQVRDRPLDVRRDRPLWAGAAREWLHRRR